MELLVKILIGLVAFIHCYILWFEMFAWDTRGKKVFKKFPTNLFSQTREMAANQGLYNGFLAAGLVWSILITDNIWSTNISLFFLIFVAIAGAYGAMTAEKKIFYVQSVPALVTIAMILLKNYVS